MICQTNSQCFVLAQKLAVRRNVGKTFKVELPDLLKKTLSSTDQIQSGFSLIRTAARNIKRCQSGTRTSKQTGAGLLIEEKSS